MSQNKIQLAALVAMSIMVIAVVLMGRDSIDCQAPATWATASGVQHCAINGGK